MPIFESRQPPIDLPTDLTTWDWLFDSPHSPLARFPESELAGYQDAISKERLNWAQVKDCSTYLSTALVKEYDLKAGETVSLFSQNSIWYPVAMHGALRVGAMVSGASPAYNVDEMAYALKTAKAKFLLTSPTSMEVATAAAKKAGIPKENLFLLEGHLEGYKTVKDLIEMGNKHGPQHQVAAFKIPAGKKNKDICGFLSFSSGTTGLPKAVMISHQNVIAQCLQIQQITPSTHKKVLAVLPSFHITGLVHVLHLPVLINAEVIALPSFTMPTMLQTIQDHRIGELLLVPPIIIRLVRDPIVANYDLSCVTRFSSGAAPLSEEIIQLLAKRFPGTGFKQGYGMTESCSCITAHPPSLYDFRYAHSVGSVVASTEIKILRPDGSEAGIDEPGEILARGPQIVMGYLDNEKATRETFDEGGWLHTGDQGVIDGEGVVTITDRIKEMIKVKGIGVAPAELEDLLLGHEKVEDVAVLGIPDEWAGERPKAFAVLKKGVAGNGEVGKQILSYVKERKARYKHVKEVEFVEEIPKSASGKILRRVLRDTARSREKRGVVVQDTAAEKAML
ncbi:acetyl-CoA synthetase-like protein [Saccharata proteae CBS 121410]|uniref:Acetyl-CoA synthetase-like protein n=1 Tax=Saccharata proteae CBS 121410 TaxID=1314787 RepID=A0A9P4LXS1_9PEZI|nr:acetyl-CoA synthetase-like protein [Saccharata proteae CBS 121410]